MKAVELNDGANGWAVQTHLEIDIAESDLLLSFPEFRHLHLSLNSMDPSNIIGMLFSYYFDVLVPDKQRIS